MMQTDPEFGLIALQARLRVPLAVSLPEKNHVPECPPYSGCRPELF
jgi:hypothetical protein